MARTRKPGAATTSLLALAAVLTAAPITARAEVVKPGEESGLGLTPGSVPDILKKAKANTYAAPAAPACQSIPREIAALDAVLGPDMDAPAEKQKASDQAGDLVTDVAKSLIPHRSIIRFLTGADRRDKERTEAATAGWARRGYLKGMYVNLGCAERGPSSPPTETAALPAAPAEASADAAVSNVAAAPAPAPAPSADHAVVAAAAEAPLPTEAAIEADRPVVPTAETRVIAHTVGYEAVSTAAR
jgi:hypothetical protein